MFNNIEGGSILKGEKSSTFENEKDIRTAVRGLVSNIKNLNFFVEKILKEDDEKGEVKEFYYPSTGFQSRLLREVYGKKCTANDLKEALKNEMFSDIRETFQDLVQNAYFKIRPKKKFEKSLAEVKINSRSEGVKPKNKIRHDSRGKFVEKSLPKGDR